MTVVDVGAMDALKAHKWVLNVEQQVSEPLSSISFKKVLLWHSAGQVAHTLTFPVPLSKPTVYMAWMNPAKRGLY